MKFDLAFPITDLKGKAGTVGSVVATGWRGLNIFRKYVQPYNPATNEQAAIRNIFSACSKAYNTMSKSQKNDWDEYAALYPIRQYGKDVVLPANSVFNRINSYRMINGQAISLNPPNSICDFAIRDVTNANYDVEPDTLNLIITHSASVITNKLLLVKITSGRNNNIVKIPSGDYRCIKGVNTNSIVALLSSGSTYSFTSPVYSPEPGQYIGISILPLSATYSPGTEFRTVSEVVATP